MPWDARTFQKHNHSLHGEKSGHAAKIANAILRRSGDEGMAIATANKWAGNHAGGGTVSREREAEILSRGRGQSRETDLNLTPLDRTSEPPGNIDTMETPGWIPQPMLPDTGGIAKAPRLPGMNRVARGGIVPHYDSGGATDPSIGGPTPAQTANPIAQSIFQRYSAYPTEKLAEMAAMMGGTQQGQMINQLLMQRRMTPPQPTQQPQQQGIMAPQAPQVAYPGQQPLARGGTVKRDMGGGMGIPSGILNEPERIDARQDSGFLHGATPGRADQVKTQAPPGAYVIPADVVAGLGEGNSLAGARIMQGILSSGPYGTPLPRSGRGMGPPRPPSAALARASAAGTLKSGGSIPIFHAKGRAGGGANTGSTPVDLSDGEYVVDPKDVDRFGDGDRTRGHRFFDAWVVHQRKKHIAKLKSLPGPVVPRGKAA